MDTSGKKIALVHDWLIHMRGGEKVLESFAELYPDATIYTLFYDRARLSPPLKRMKIQASFLQKIPGIKVFYRWLLPFLPRIVRTLKIEPVDIVLSSSHCVAKGVSLPHGAIHICYIHTPMRYLYGYEEDYFSRFPGPLRFLIKRILAALRKWDLAANENVDFFISNSENVRKRIQNFYNRDAEVIYPPVDADFFSPAQPPSEPGDYYLVVSAFVPYKRVDLVIEAFNTLERRLLIVGAGPMERTYRKLRKSHRISFLGAVQSTALRELFRNAKAVIFPTDEDFGIVPLEAQACGAPVIALGKGGALESVKSGLFFYDQTPAALKAAVMQFESMNFKRNRIPIEVESFDKSHFKRRIDNFVATAGAKETASVTG